MEKARWVFANGLAHVLTDDGGNASTFVGVCGLTVPATVPVYGVAPSLDVCQSCWRVAVFEVAPPPPRVSSLADGVLKSPAGRRLSRNRPTADSAPPLPTTGRFQNDSATEKEV